MIIQRKTIKKITVNRFFELFGLVGRLKSIACVGSKKVEAIEIKWKQNSDSMKGTIKTSELKRMLGPKLIPPSTITAVYLDGRKKYIRISITIVKYKSVRRPKPKPKKTKVFKSAAEHKKKKRWIF